MLTELPTRRPLNAGAPLRAAWRAVPFTLICVLFAALAVVTALPSKIGLTGLPLLLMVVAFPMFLGAGLLLVSMLLAAWSARRRDRHRALRLAAAIVIGTVGLAHCMTVITRGWWSDGAPSAPGDIVVVSFNSAGIEPLPGALTSLIAETRPQIIALPETSQATAKRLAGRAAELGLEYQVFAAVTLSSVPSTTSLLVATSLGEYRLDADASSRTGVVRVLPASGVGPVIVGVHPTSPNLDGGASEWRHAGRTAVAECVSTPGAIVAGDFNATLNHPQFAELGRCRDAADVMRRSGEGTWPAWMPAPFASAIDHVLVDGERWKVVDFGTRGVGDSDHRLVITTVRAL